MISRAKAKAPSSRRLRVVTLRNRAEYVDYCRSHEGELADQRRVERELAATADASFAVPGRCEVCNREVEFQASYAFAYEIDGTLTPNWREHLRCPSCGLTNRTRATVHVVKRLLRARSTSAIYLTEQRTELYRWMEGRFRSLVGSEFFGDRLPYGTYDESGVRNEDVRGRFRRRARDAVLVTPARTPRPRSDALPRPSTAFGAGCPLPGRAGPDVGSWRPLGPASRVRLNRRYRTSSGAS